VAVEQQDFEPVRLGVVFVEPGQFVERGAVGVGQAGAREGIAVALAFVVAARIGCCRCFTKLFPIVL
jgi:hypothetical protein